METQEQLQFSILINASKEIGLRYQAIFQLKNINTVQAIKKMMEAYPFVQESILLTHEILYALGQLNEDKVEFIREFLIGKVNDPSQNNLARHQSAEALANYFLPELEQLYTQHLDSPCKELRYTCEIALQKVRQSQLRKQYGKLYYETKEPAAPYSQPEFQAFLKENSLEELYQKEGYLGILLKEQISLFQKYRIMYKMRNEKNNKNIEVLCSLLSRQYSKTQTSLLKHEICFILGQIGCENHEGLVQECIENEEEESIVRHEALSTVASQSKNVQYLDQFITHPDQLIRESAQVAQFSIKYWNS